MATGGRVRKLVLWGHDVDEYKEMFALSQTDLEGSILEFGCGPSAVNKQLTDKGREIVSVDDMFVKNKDELSIYVDNVFQFMLAEVKKHQTQFLWDDYGSLDDLVKTRQDGIAAFLNDYEKGQKQKRYLERTEHLLPFEDFHFDLALSSHYLFANLDNQDVDFHIYAIRELTRVAKEVRIFPLIDRDDNVSQFLGPVMLGLQQDKLGIEVKQVPYHLQPKGNAMLRVFAQECVV
jgi:SAM-dependent methyltransferase